MKSSELREGPTYSSGVGIEAEDSLDIEDIPPPQTVPAPQSIKSGRVNKAYFDLETTSLSLDCDIVQLSAVCTDRMFDTYIVPNKPIGKTASAVNGITCHSGQMAYLGKPVKSETPLVALQTFIHWLEECKPVVLVAHNGRKFDAPLILRHVSIAKLTAAFADCVIGFVDTRPLFEEICLDMPNYKQETLVSKILHVDYQAHNSLEDVKALQKLCMHEKVPDESFQKHSVTTASLLHIMEHGQLTERNMASMATVVGKKIVSPAMGEKMAQSGLCWEHVKKAHMRDTVSGVESLFKEKNNGKVRVTASRKIISKVTEFLNSQ